MTDDFHVVFPLYAGLTQLDFSGPFEVFSRVPGARTVVGSVAGGGLELSRGFGLTGLVALRDVERCDLLCVPGGYGCVAAMGDPNYLAELRRLGALAKTVTSVCTGSLLLAAAGLLEGKRAACHWAWRHLLTEFDVVADPARIVRDGSVITGGGVTAGIDLALAVVAEVAGRDVAQALQLALEYAPAPPFDAGRPETAPPHVLERVRTRIETLGQERTRAVRLAARELASRRVAPGAPARNG